MQILTQSHDYEGGLALLQQEYLATLSDIVSAEGLGAARRSHLLLLLRNEHERRCAQEWRAIRDQIRADQDVRKRRGPVLATPS